MPLVIRDASGRRISLLNDEDEPPVKRLSRSNTASSYYPQVSRTASTPNTPELFRSNSYDSNMGTEPISPMTPLYEPAMRYPPAVAGHHRPSFEEYYPDVPHMYPGAKRRPSALSDGRSVSYDDDLTTTTASERPGKRYPCRYRDTHGCEKTFTTSGHASRHSKIHTAEKAVPCSFKGCPKKFTRADNMKQHLETHYKDKSRSSSSRPSLSSSSRPSLSLSERRTPLPRPSSLALGERRSSFTQPSSSSGKSSSRHKMVPVMEPAGSIRDPQPSPRSGTWSLGTLNGHLQSQHSSGRSASSGLDALAFAVACKEGSELPLHGRPHHARS